MEKFKGKRNSGRNLGWINETQMYLRGIRFEGVDGI